MKLYNNTDSVVRSIRTTERISIAGAAAAAAIPLLLMFSFIFPRVPSVFFYSLVILIFHEIFKNLAVVQRHHIMPRKWDHFRNSFRSFYDPLNFMKSNHFLGVIWCLCTAARFLNISWKNMREEEEKGGTRGNMLHLIVLEYSCSLKWKIKQ